MLNIYPRLETVREAVRAMERMIRDRSYDLGKEHLPPYRRAELEEEQKQDKLRLAKIRSALFQVKP